jgi:hypothetical protein
MSLISPARPRTNGIRVLSQRARTVLTGYATGETEGR